MPYQKDPGYYVNGGIIPFILDGPSGYLPPTITVQDELETTIAGVNIMLIHAPGETSDIIFVWLPEKKVLVEIGNFYKSFPAIITLRGASFRNPLDYIESIDKMRGLNADPQEFYNFLALLLKGHMSYTTIPIYSVDLNFIGSKA